MRSQQLAQADSRPPLQVTLPEFEGPFDLLIYLVERDQLDIYAISIADITSSYLASLSQVEFEPDLASDFIYMAAYLLELKSRSLLPRLKRESLAAEPDPRQELIMRLVEYKRFKQLAALLESMISPGQYDYTRPPCQLPAAASRTLAPLSLDNLFSAFARALKNRRLEVRNLTFQGVSVEVRLGELRQTLAAGGIGFADLVRGLGLEEVVATFLALLELVRLGEALVYQERVFAPIRVEPKEGGLTSERTESGSRP